ncbi:hypothetical protein Verru16b_02638 [Lacunisphaera limnophila]|uniref:Uncharacterized protein n=1 Tax=Lacunisphaera limnophila TaxID=1838286 RepID=A0A1D8AXF8_9BACT|nr:hypothetical protein [Lacunisphaera limnophila]AOS45557.1 hypothetical protein Verru16b_02638 [Lacunisphaera limnophila]
MGSPLKRRNNNPWMDQDRQNQRRVIATGVLFALIVLGGVGLLVYALVQG